MTIFTVSPPSRNEPSEFSGIVLQQDNWNDYSFQTLYHLYVSVPDFTGRIGQVKILRRGQTASDPLQLPLGPLTPLTSDWVSLGQDLDYYQRLAELPAELRQEILTHLRDALAFPAHAETFFDEEGWSTSVLRYVDWDSFRRDGSVLLEGNFDRLAQVDLTIKFQMTGWSDPLQLNFRAPDADLFLDEQCNLPDRISVIIGRNGSGKSTLLSRLARILHASQRDRAEEALAALGSIEPSGVGFTRIINVAYSAFDAFQLPGIDYRERRQIIEDVERGVGRYYYCGLRDIAKEVRRAEGVGDIDGRPIEPLGLDRQEFVIFKASEVLTSEFVASIARIQQQGRVELFEKVCAVLASDISFADLGDSPGVSILNHPGDWFKTWSTGHKIVMHATASLVANTEPKSIVLMDEPESHLHPPLLAAFMHSVRLILRHHDAFGVIATHSPVVVQESLRRHISVVRRTGAETHISRPRIETYGESIGEITNEIFGLNANTTDYHIVLNNLVGFGMSVDDIDNLFDRGLSLQARAYVMTEIARRER
ncbi:hypothetical protein BV509_01150 [Rhodovulum sulfidophilum]|uniref:AAA family ATPase n=1 Tax=Rhodovulum visakhapatnamense TaxID=364297 RepID=A0ABS1RLL0_9RHOB|nr:AAA family ATPase [Rhodovulum visakhapatnamense]MBL3571571.1 AAA family ATPase [Rhodovulum visakhapatnamense]MBL3579556.1 AAA family ATPase [Rhodovulum visakhapatnamense]OLS43093.1 hypothetical protein BV509_01150 [Rhodovulum sulfidophilum]